MSYLSYPSYMSYISNVRQTNFWRLGVRPWRSASGRDVAKGADSAERRDFAKGELAPGRVFAPWWLSSCWAVGYGKHVPQVYRILRYKCTVKYRKVPQNVLREMGRNRSRTSIRSWLL